MSNKVPYVDKLEYGEQSKFEHSDDWWTMVYMQEGHPALIFRAVGIEEISKLKRDAATIKASSEHHGYTRRDISPPTWRSS